MSNWSLPVVYMDRMTIFLLSWRVIKLGFSANQTVTSLSPEPGSVDYLHLQPENTDSSPSRNVAISDAIPAELIWAGQLRIEPPISATLGQPPALVTRLNARARQAITFTLPMTVNLGLANGTLITQRSP